jgi:CelD/BcsL family acetyltransferase involved in cellulose biosynthesis
VSTVVAIDPTDPRVDGYARRHPAALAYHLGAWAAVFEETYSFQPHYLALEGESGDLEGLLPLMYHRKGPLSSARLNSLPAVPSAGPIADTREGAAALLEAACRLRESMGADVLMVKSRTGGYEGAVPGLRQVAPGPLVWKVDLPDDPAEIRARWKKRSNNVWRSVRKAEANGIDVRVSSSEEDLRAFYHLYLRTMRKHRYLPRPLRQMESARRRLPPGVFRIFLAEHRGALVGGALWHAFGQTLELLYSGSDERALELRPNHALYARAATWAIEHDLRCLDFGPAPLDSPLAAFKSQWTAEPVDDYTYFHTDSPPAPSGAPVTSVSGAPLLSRVRRSFSPERPAVHKAWGAAPLPVTRVAGEIVFRYL